MFRWGTCAPVPSRQPPAIERGVSQGRAFAWGEGGWISGAVSDFAQGMQEREEDILPHCASWPSTCFPMHGAAYERPWLWSCMQDNNPVEAGEKVWFLLTCFYQLAHPQCSKAAGSSNPFSSIRSANLVLSTMCQRMIHILRVDWCVRHFNSSSDFWKPQYIFWNWMPDANATARTMTDYPFLLLRDRWNRIHGNKHIATTSGVLLHTGKLTGSLTQPSVRPARQMSKAIVQQRVIRWALFTCCPSAPLR